MLREIMNFLNDLGTPEQRGPASLLYNEGWLLRLTLAAEARGIRCLPQPFAPGARWFTEALLYTPFRPRKRGDRLGESVTHADGVIGHFEIGRSSRAGLHLTPDPTQFIIVEAKMFSGLSTGTTRAKGYDQAARNVACLAEAVRMSKRPPEAFRSLGFWVLAPDSQIKGGTFACVDRQTIAHKIRDRIEAYEPEWKQERLEPWLRDSLAPVLERVDLACVPWEEVLENIRRTDPGYADALQEFYERCLTFNRPAGKSE
jgi:hypothetical protein